MSDFIINSKVSVLGVMNVKSYGVLGDGIANEATELNTLLTAIDSTVTDLYFPKGTYLLSTNVTVPSNVRVELAKGAVLKVSNTFVLTLNCEIKSGLYQIFDLSLGGTIAGSLRNSEVYPEWWGALGDNLTDITALTLKILSSLSNVGTIKFTNGTYLINNTLTIPEGIILSVTKGAIIKVVNTSSIEAVSASLINLMQIWGSFPRSSGGIGTGWYINGSATSKSVADNVQTFTPSGQYQGLAYNVPYTVGDKIYSCAYVSSSSSGTRFQIGDIDSTPSSGTNHTGGGSYEFLSGLVTTASSPPQAINAAYIYSSLASGWTPISIKQVVAYNLTVIFGAGNEPSKATMDAYILLKAKEFTLNCKIIAGRYQIFDIGVGRTVIVAQNNLCQEWFNVALSNIGLYSGANQKGLFEANNINMLERAYTNTLGGGIK